MKKYIIYHIREDMEDENVTELYPYTVFAESIQRAREMFFEQKPGYRIVKIEEVDFLNKN